MKYLSIALIFAALSSPMLLAPQANAEVHFRQAGFEEAKKLAVQEHKKIMVDFYTSWCGWCKVLDSKTYTDDHVGKIADAKFISIKLDAEHGEGATLAKNSKIRGYPTIIFFSETGEEIDRVVGYEDAPTFARSLESAANGGSKAVLDEINGPHPPADPAKWAIAATYYQQHTDNDRAIGAYRQVVELDPENKQHLKEQAVYDIALLTNGDSKYELLEQALIAFPMRPEGQQAVGMLINYYFESKKATDAARVIDRWAMSHPDDAPAFNAFAWAAAEHNAMLDKAVGYAKRAVALATDKTNRAIYMDSEAEVLYKQGHKADAAKIESDAIALLDPKVDHKLLEQLNFQKGKFDGTVVDMSDDAPKDEQPAAPVNAQPQPKN